MATRPLGLKEEPQPTVPEAKPVTAVVEARNVNDLFSRSVNAIGPVRQLQLRRVLTRPMVTMTKLKSLAVQCQSEVYTLDLPNKGRGGGVSAAVVFDAKQLIPTERGFQDGPEIIVACHAIMAHALKSAGYATIIKSVNEDLEDVITPFEGRPLKGALLAFLSGDIEDGKRYRSISVAELE